MSVMICAWCGETNDAHLGDPNEAGPEPGDVSLCWHCLGVSIYTETEQGRKPTKEEMNEIITDERVIKAVLAVAVTRTPTETAKVMGWEDRG